MSVEKFHQQIDAIHEDFTKKMEKPQQELKNMLKELREELEAAKIEEIRKSFEKN